ncbi:MAG: hypothetical protein IPJ58_07240 [Ardenticatenia bacterium]|nr:hypothetical protein [Ardenticatenia bacterium]
MIKQTYKGHGASLPLGSPWIRVVKSKKLRLFISGNQIASIAIVSAIILVGFSLIIGQFGNTRIQLGPGPTPVPVDTIRELRRDNFSSTSSGWDNYTNLDEDLKPLQSTGYEDGEYFIDIKSRMLFLSTWKAAGAIENAILQVDALGPMSEGGAKSQGLAFGWRPEWVGTTYAFVINDNGLCGFLEDTGRSGWWPKVLARSRSLASNKPYHTLRVQIRDGNALGFVDDSFCAEHQLTNYHPGLGRVCKVTTRG